MIEPSVATVVGLLFGVLALASVLYVTGTFNDESPDDPEDE